MKSVPQAEDTLLAHMMILVGLRCSSKAPVGVCCSAASAVRLCGREEKKTKERKEEEGNKMTIANRSGDRLPLGTDEGRTCQWWWL
jgi:hypothetical protein